MSVHPESESDDARQSSAVDEADQRTSISKDDAFHVLQNARRRAVLRYLFEHDDQDRFVMRDVAEAVAAWEHDTTVQQLRSTERQRVYIALYQSHLPKLAEHGIIEYDQSRGVIEMTELTAVLAPYLEDGLRTERELTVADSTDAATEEQSPFTMAVSSLFAK